MGLGQGLGRPSRYSHGSEAWATVALLCFPCFPSEFRVCFELVHSSAEGAAYDLGAVFGTDAGAVPGE